MKNDTENKHQSEPNGFSFSRSFRFDSIRFIQWHSLRRLCTEAGANRKTETTKSNHKFRLNAI